MSRISAAILGGATRKLTARNMSRATHPSTWRSIERFVFAFEGRIARTSDPRNWQTRSPAFVYPGAKNMSPFSSKASLWLTVAHFWVAHKRSWNFSPSVVSSISGIVVGKISPQYLMGSGVNKLRWGRSNGWSALSNKQHLGCSKPLAAPTRSISVVMCR